MGRIVIALAIVAIITVATRDQGFAHAGEDHDSRVGGAFHSLGDVALPVVVIAAVALAFWWSNRGKQEE
jgi:hypothetical protein